LKKLKRTVEHEKYDLKKYQILRKNLKTFRKEAEEMIKPKKEEDDNKHEDSFFFVKLKIPLKIFPYNFKINPKTS
jgi:hypothetical protein